MLVVVALWWGPTGRAGPPAGTSIPPGFDLLVTDPQTSFFQMAIPADFFGPGSDPFNGQVNFAGDPLGMFNGQHVGDADTVVQRPNEANPSPGDTVPIEIVALNLVSVEPITVTRNGGQDPEPWDVRVDLSPTEPSQGQITINQTGAMGGTFQSQLVVTPLLTFTNLNDGTTRTFDTASIPQAQRLLQANGPWRAGCIPPALRVPGFNEFFCPGLTPEGFKQLVVHDAPVVDHGVYPAQPHPEHFKCYLLDKEKFKKRRVDLADQFGNRQARVKKRRELCNPVRKNSEEFLNKRAHLVCYATRSPDLQRVVAVVNQFGSQRLVVGRAQHLCVPSQKRERGRFKPVQTQIDHYQCYGVKPQTPIRRLGKLGKVKLKDQFDGDRYKVRKPVRLCAPVQKNLEPVHHPVNHYVCYRIRDDRKARQIYAIRTNGRPRVEVEIRNQFEKRKVAVIESEALCVPTAKLPNPA